MSLAVRGNLQIFSAEAQNPTLRIIPNSGYNRVQAILFFH